MLTNNMFCDVRRAHTWQYLLSIHHISTVHTCMSMDSEQLRRSMQAHLTSSRRKAAVMEEGDDEAAMLHAGLGVAAGPGFVGHAQPPYLKGSHSFQADQREAHRGFAAGQVDDDNDDDLDNPFSTDSPESVPRASETAAQPTEHSHAAAPQPPEPGPLKPGMALYHAPGPQRIDPTAKFCAPLPEKFRTCGSCSGNQACRP
eukprot:366444-Chlamydomonas_euryale.AAC.41